MSNIRELLEKLDSINERQNWDSLNAVVDQFAQQGMTLQDLAAMEQAARDVVERGEGVVGGLGAAARSLVSNEYFRVNYVLYHAGEKLGLTNGMFGTDGRLRKLNGSQYTAERVQPSDSAARNIAVAQARLGILPERVQTGFGIQAGGSGETMRPTREFFFTPDATSLQGHSIANFRGTEPYLDTELRGELTRIYTRARNAEALRSAYPNATVMKADGSGPYFNTNADANVGTNADAGTNANAGNAEYGQSLRAFAASDQRGLANNPEATGAIRELHQFLGAFNLPIDADDAYGQQTRESVKRLQRAFKAAGIDEDISDDGDVGPITIAAIERYREDMRTLANLVNVLPESIRLRSSISKILIEAEDPVLTDVQLRQLNDIVNKYKTFLTNITGQEDLSGLSFGNSIGRAERYLARPEVAQRLSGATSEPGATTEGPYREGQEITAEINEKLTAVGREQGIVGETLTAEDAQALNQGVTAGTITGPSEAPAANQNVITGRDGERDWELNKSERTAVFRNTGTGANETRYTRVNLRDNVVYVTTSRGGELSIDSMPTFIAAVREHLPDPMPANFGQDQAPVDGSGTSNTTVSGEIPPELLAPDSNVVITAEMLNGLTEDQLRQVLQAQVEAARALRQKLNDSVIKNVTLDTLFEALLNEELTGEEAADLQRRVRNIQLILSQETLTRSTNTEIQSAITGARAWLDSVPEQFKSATDIDPANYNPQAPVGGGGGNNGGSNGGDDTVSDTRPPIEPAERQAVTSEPWGWAQIEIQSVKNATYKFNAPEDEEQLRTIQGLGVIRAGQTLYLRQNTRRGTGSSGWMLSKTGGFNDGMPLDDRDHPLVQRLVAYLRTIGVDARGGLGVNLEPLDDSGEQILDLWNRADAVANWNDGLLQDGFNRIRSRDQMLTLLYQWRRRNGGSDLLNDLEGAWTVTDETFDIINRKLREYNIPRRLES